MLINLADNKIIRYYQPEKILLMWQNMSAQSLGGKLYNIFLLPQFPDQHHKMADSLVQIY